MAKSLAEMIGAARADIGEISPQDASTELAGGTTVLLDVREPTEFGDHIADAVQVPRGILEFAADPASPRHHPQLDPGTRVIVYCRSGARAVLAAETLKTMGYTDVVNLAGGFSAWTDAKLPVVEQHAGL